MFFLRLFRWFSLRNLRTHWGRALVVLLGIALGAAVFTSVRLAVHASLSSFVRSMDFFAGAAQKVLVRPGGHLPEGVLPVLLGHPAVKEFSPLLTTYVRRSGVPGDSFLMIGIDQFNVAHVTTPPKTRVKGLWVDKSVSLPPHYL